MKQKIIILLRNGKALEMSDADQARYDALCQSVKEKEKEWVDLGMGTLKSFVKKDEIVTVILMEEPAAA